MKTIAAILTDISPCWATVEILNATFEDATDCADNHEVVWVPEGTKEGDRVRLSACDVIADIMVLY